VTLHLCDWVYVCARVFLFNTHASSFILYSVHPWETPFPILLVFLSFCFLLWYTLPLVPFSLSPCSSLSPTSVLCFSSSLLPCVYLPVSFHLIFLPFTFFSAPSIAPSCLVLPMAVCGEWQHTNKSFGKWYRGKHKRKLTQSHLPRWLLKPFFKCAYALTHTFKSVCKI